MKNFRFQNKFKTLVAGLFFTIAFAGCERVQSLATSAVNSKSATLDNKKIIEGETGEKGAVGSFEYAVKLQSKMQSGEYSLETEDLNDAKSPMVKGAYLSDGKEQRVLMTFVNYGGESEGDWWFGAGSKPPRAYHRENGKWIKKPKEPSEFQRKLSLAIAIERVDESEYEGKPVFVKTENVGGAACNHFVRRPNENSEYTSHFWINKKTGYAMRRLVEDKSGKPILRVNASRQDELTEIEMPPDETETPARSTQSSPGGSPNDCGNHPVRSLECAVSKPPTNRQFSIEIIKPDGSRRTYAGEFIKVGQEVVVLRVTITGVSAASNGEWWDKLGLDDRTTDANNTFRKENGVWSRVRAKPKEQEYQNLFLASGVVQMIDIAAAYAPVKIGEEAINGENCNHFQIKYIADGSQSVADVWVSKRTGYAMRRKMKTPAETTIVNESRQGENISIETPRGAN